MKRLICISLLLAACTSLAQTVTARIEWTPPISREDGTVLPLNEVAGYEIHYTKKGAVPGPLQQIFVVGGSKTFVELTVAAPETYNWTIAAYDTDNKYSSFIPVGQNTSVSSSSSSSSVSGKVLRPPSDFRVIRFNVSNCSLPNCKIIN